MAPAAQGVVAILVALAWAAPPLLARQFADTLDRGPYLTCAAAGVLAAAVLGSAYRARLRAAFTGAGGTRWAGRAIALAVVLAPTWAIGVGLGANRVLDRSAEALHPSRVLRWDRPGKGRASCVVTSWRGRDHESLADALVLRTPGGPACAPGAAILIGTRTGALGWEWVTGVSRADGRSGS